MRSVQLCPFEKKQSNRQTSYVTSHQNLQVSDTSDDISAAVLSPKKTAHIK